LSAFVSARISPIAFASVDWKYYPLFICTNAVSAMVVFMIFPETNEKSLKEISTIFSGQVVTADLNDIQEKSLMIKHGEHVKEARIITTTVETAKESATTRENRYGGLEAGISRHIRSCNAVSI
jgi:hypothetical protein